MPLAAFVVWWLVIKADYAHTEKIFLALCVLFFSYVISGILIDPPWKEVLLASVKPSFAGDAEFLLLAIGVVGTTITPWGQFYVQASVVDKEITAKDYVYTRWDVFIGSFFTGFIAFFIMVATAATLYVNHIPIETVKDAAIALEPLAGKYASLLFAAGLFGASMLAAFILPLSTAYPICEAFGFESGISKTFKEAPVFFGLYTVVIAFSAAMVLWPGLSLYHVMLATQVVNGILLPPILIFMVMIANNKDIMGEYSNSRLYNILTWTFTIVLIMLTVLLLTSTLFPGLIEKAQVFLPPIAAIEPTLYEFN
ncbi:NRAMP family divalent metal transporter [Methylomusa anaerophila]|uniref:Divalent metal cation transporter MntH n=1 Tax=Methylomusa anaerophila TaxID=1930071 RepID=A0A348AH42_9FIRM|nr:divalent metal cation transporter [Methylomusa anaerophila]BBB90390.1 divalent metal cation transporter MntH [Methylomusa anaerophila]